MQLTSKFDKGIRFSSCVIDIFSKYAWAVSSDKKGVPDVVKNINVKVCNLISITNETRHTSWHETSKM